MLRGRLTPASVYLSLVCLPIFLMSNDAKPCSTDVITKVEALQQEEKISTCSDCMLYTPTVEDYMKCPGSTLKCFADEIQVLIEEWDAIPGVGGALKTSLAKLAQRRVAQDSRRLGRRTGFKATSLQRGLSSSEHVTECPQCELHKKQSTEQFLKHLYSTIQKMNSQKCDTDQKKTQ